MKLANFHVNGGKPVYTLPTSRRVLLHVIVNNVNEPCFFAIWSSISVDDLLAENANEADTPNPEPLTEASMDISLSSCERNLPTVDITEASLVDEQPVCVVIC